MTSMSKIQGHVARVKAAKTVEQKQDELADAISAIAVLIDNLYSELRRIDQKVTRLVR